MAPDALGAAGVRRVCYELEVGHSGRGGGILCRHAHCLFLLLCCRFLLHKMYPVSEKESTSFIFTMSSGNVVEFSYFDW